MSSTGIISDVMVGAPTTVSAEKSRKTSQEIGSFPGLQEGIRQTYGIISEVHPNKPQVKAYADDGSTIAGDRFIPLAHSVSDIVERFGTVRKGMRVLVTYSGPDGSHANAMIIGVEGERSQDTVRLQNEIKTGLFEVFSPGIGVG